jgi:NDP-sugar pyrophosphorylase family protein
MKTIESNLPLISVEVLVLAGGLGTRFSKVMNGTPKLLAPIAGRPFLDHLISWLSRYGVRKIVLSLGHLAQEIIDHLAANPYPGVEIDTIVEGRPLGTAGGIANARSLLTSDPVMVMNGDSFIDANLGNFLDFHNVNQFGASIICARVDDVSRYGSVEVTSNGRITAFREKDAAVNSVGTINGGVYLLGARALDNIVLLGTGSVEKDFFAVQSEISIGGFVGDFGFMDFGTPESYKTAQNFFTKPGITNKE